ncbi:MAG: peptidylprolyl isomerase [Bacteroidetes bacterium]|nr:peptidylprolyl isomerase [Bacteroidota bacterium]HNR20895.1 peptidylprolyl isomerase [Bacteroidia bacterium]HNU34103.1 peptidylprolyl isomerase [Bacteroidia bacterium]
MKFIKVSALLFFLALKLVAQPASNVIDQVAAVVGNKIITHSDVEAEYLQFVSGGNYGGNDVRCKIFEQLLMSKLLVYQANIDSIEVTDDQVEGEIDKRISYFIEQFGSEEKMEEYYKKSLVEIKEEFKPVIKEQMQAQMMQSKIVKNATASPSDVKTYYNGIPKDSLPYINAEIEYAEIVLDIRVSNEEKQSIKTSLNEFKERVKKGEEFSTLAILYSKDPGSAKQGGELGFLPRGQLVPEFEAAAFKLKPGEMSDVVETKFGYHLIQMIERRGEQINVRHILLKPAVSSADLLAEKNRADSIADAIRTNKISFADAALKYSADESTKSNGGNVVNRESGNTRFETSQVDATVFFHLDKLKKGEVSEAVLTTTREGKQVYKIYLLKNRTQPHVANLTDDYQRLQTAALNNKQQKLLEDWVKRKKKSTFIQIADDYKFCDITKNWMN